MTQLVDRIERWAALPSRVIPAGFLASLLFVIFGPYVNYAPKGYIDPWLYTGYFTNHAYIQAHYGTTYYFSRLPWTIPGLIVFQIATPVVASILLNACLLATCGLSLYFAIGWYYGAFPAVLASIALATNPWYFSSVAWDYPDGPAIAYGFLAVVFALKPHGSRPANSILMAVFLSLSGFTNMSGAPMVLSVLAFPLWRSRRSPAGLVREIAYIVAGVAGTMIVLMPVSKVLLGYWLFFMPQLDLARQALKQPEVLLKMWGPGDGFLLKAYHLFPVALLLVFGLALLAALRKRAPAAWPSYLALLACTMIYSFQEFVLHGVVLHVAYHSVYMVVPLFVLAGVIFGELWRRSELHREWVRTTCLVLLSMALPYAMDAYRQKLFAPGLWTRMFVAGAIAMLLLAGLRAARTGFRIAIILFLLPLLYIGPASESLLYASIDTTNRDDFHALMSFNEALKANMPLERRAVFWADQDERDHYLFVSAQALWVFGAYDFRRAFQGAVPDDMRYQLATNTTLVHLTDHPERINEHLKLLDSHGVRYTNKRQWTVGSGQSLFYVAAEDIVDISALH